MQLITKTFHKEAIAFPSRVDAMLATVQTAEQAKGILDKAAALQEYAQRLKVGVEVEKPIAKGVLKIKAKLGELIPAKPPSDRGQGRNGKKSTIPGVVDLDAAPSTLSAYRKLANNADKLEDYCESIDDVPTQTDFIRWCGADPDRHTKNSGNMEWYTPAEYVDRCRDVLGEIDLDPASNKHAQQIVQAQQFYSADDCGLQHAWIGRVFMNPPYRMPLVEQFVFKLCEHYEAGDIKAAILLTNNSTDPQWWQRAGRLAAAICFTAGRIKFYNHDGVANSPTHGQTFMYFGRAVKKFEKHFADIGVIK